MPIKYVPFIPEPVEGQAVLSNFNRILRYRGADEMSMVLQRGMPLYEVEKAETVGRNDSGNMVIRGECVSACAYLKEQGIEVDLVYIDPPFASGADYAKKVYVRRNPKVAEVIKKAEEELDIDELKSFEEKMYGDVWDKEKYLNWMYENLIAIKSIMNDTASIYVHLDWHIGHYVKILLDEIFGESNFRNEIVWHYDIGTAPKTDFKRKHDNIYRYSKNDKVIFNELRISSKNKERYTEVDADGRRYMVRGDTGKIVFEDDGQVEDDVWTYYKGDEFRTLNSMSHQRRDIGYSTQKPEALLERIIKTSSNENMVIADFFGGSGVTSAVASKLSRKFIHCDIGINSIQTTRDRLKSINAEFDVLEIKDGVQLFRNPVQTMDKIKSIITGLKNEDSLNSFWEGSISDSKYGMIPVYVPNLMDSSSKLLDKVLMNRIIHQAIPDLDNSVKKVIVYYIDITDIAEIEKFISDDDSTTVEIELRDLKLLLDDVVVEDYANFNIEEIKDNLLGGYKVTINTFVSDRVQQKIFDFNQKSLMNTKKSSSFKPIEISKEGLELIEYLSLDCTNSEKEWHSDSEVKIDKNGFLILNGEKTKEFWDGTISSETKPFRIKIRNICGDESIYNI